MKMKSIEELHKMTRQELVDYCNDLFSVWTEATTVRDYRNRIGDDYNPFLLEAKNATVEDGEEE